MDTKKRPNEDLLDSETDPSPATTALTATTVPPQPSESTTVTTSAAASTETGGNLPSAMEVDSTESTLSESIQPSPATHSAAIMAAENMQPLGSEANKRVKLMMETSHTGSDFSPSNDLTDPSRESKGLAEWVVKMDKDDHPTGNRSIWVQLIVSIE